MWSEPRIRMSEGLSSATIGKQLGFDNRAVLKAVLPAGLQARPISGQS